MSSLWTPGGEHPVNPDPAPKAPGPSADGPPAADPNLDDEIAAALPDGVRLDDLSPEERARAEEMVKEMAEARVRLLETPAAMIVANHGMGLYELAALHLSEEAPDFAQATVAIDALSAIVDSLEGRLGDAEPTLREARDQLRMAFVQLKNQSGSTETGGE
jgi:hypothetical protein